MISKKLRNIYLGIAASSLLAIGLYSSARPPVTVSMTFDAQKQIAKVSLKNESSRRILFYDTFTKNSKKLVTTHNVPPAIRVKMFSPEGDELSNIGTFAKKEGWINVVDDYFTLDSQIELTALAPHQTVFGEAKLADLIGERPPYSELKKLKNFCVQFKATIIFNSRAFFPLEKKSDLACLKDGMK